MKDSVYRAIIEKSSSGYAYNKIIYDKNRQPCDYEIIEVNSAFERLIGLKASDIIGKRITKVFEIIEEDEFDRIKLYGDIAENLGNEEFVKYDKSTDRYYKINAYSIEKGYFVTLFSDISNEMNQFNELERFFSVNLDLLCIADTDGYFKKVNKQWETVLGYTVDEIQNQKFLDFIHPEDMEETLKAISNLDKQIEVQNFVNRYRCKDGSYRYIEWRSKPHGKHIFAAARDITYNIVSQNVIKERETNFSAFFEAIDDMLIVGTTEGKILYTNNAVTERLGYSKDELSNMGIMDLHPMEKREEAGEIFAEMFRGERDYCPLPLLKKNGSYLPVETRVSFGKWNGEYCIFGISKDLSKQQAALEKFHKLFDNNPALMAVSGISKNGFIEVNSTFLDKLGYSKAEVLGKTSEELNLFVNIEKYEEISRKLLEEGTFKNIELQIRKKNGEILDGLFSGEIINDQIEENFLTVMLDITERKKAELKLEKKDKMLGAIATATNELLVNRNYYNAMAKGFTLMGEATEVDRIFLFKNDYYKEQSLNTTRQKIEWSSKYIESQSNNKRLQKISFDQIKGLINILSQNKPYISSYELLKNSRIKSLIDDYSILSLIIFPIYVKDKFWGFVGLEDSNVHRTWTRTEKSLLSSYVGSIAKAIERSMTEKELKYAKVAAEAASITKSQFLANMSHEIRTPMNGIRGFLQLLSKTNINEEQNFYLGEISKASDNLLYIINEILDLSRIEAGKMELIKSKFNFKAIINDAVSLLKPLANEKGLEVILNAHYDLPDNLFGDSVKLKQIINNLVNNSIKFTDKGRIEITTKTLKNSDDKVLINISISDTGIGMENKTIKNLFNPFMQADTSNTRNYGGTGLGLFIVKRLVEMMNGTIEVNSELGKGSIFSVSVELEKVNSGKCNKKVSEIKKEDSYINENNDYYNTKYSHRNNNKKPVKALVVEDDDMSRLLLIKILQKEGVYCEYANNGKLAIEACKNKKYDIIFMDCQMPIMDGYEATKYIKQSQNKFIPIIAITANAMQGDMEKCIHAGMDDYLCKPIDVSEILKMLNRYTNFNGKKLINNMEDKIEEKIELKFEDIVIKLVNQLKITDMDAQLIVKEFLTVMPYHISSLEAALSELDYFKIKKIAHSLKGLTSNLRINVIFDEVVKLEGAANVKSVYLCRSIIENIRELYLSLKNNGGKEG